MDSASMNSNMDKRDLKNITSEIGMVVHVCNPSPLEVETARP